MQDAEQKEMGRDAKLVPSAGLAEGGEPRKDEGTAGHGARPVEIIDVDEWADGEREVAVEGDSGRASAAKAATAPEGKGTSGADTGARNERKAVDGATSGPAWGGQARRGCRRSAHGGCAMSRDGGQRGGVRGRLRSRRQQCRGRRRVRPGHADMLY